MSDNHDLIEHNEVSKAAMGGTEMMMRRLFDGYVARDVLEQFQIIPSRVRDLNPNKYRILWVHDLKDDPELEVALKDDGWNRFHMIVFCAHMQAQGFIERYNIPWSRTMVLHNAIDPIEAHEKPTDKVNLIYHTTPHRGLNVLLSIYDNIVKNNPDVHLDVYSSFKIYGWDQKDMQFQGLFDYCKNHPNITYHGSKPNAEVREGLKKAHIFAYPSVWQECHCISLIEAMSAGLLCVHSDLGGLPEGACNWTNMYRYTENQEDHARLFYAMLNDAITEVKKPEVKGKLNLQKGYTDIFFSWNNRKVQWNAMLKGILARGESRDLPGQTFVYRSAS